MTTSSKVSRKEARKAGDKVVASGEDDVVVSTVMGDVRGARYPHILNHISTYVIPSIDEVLELHQEAPPPGDPAPDSEPIYPTRCNSDPGPLHKEQGSMHKQSCDFIVVSMTNAHEGTSAPEVIGPGSGLYNLRYVYPPELAPKTDTNEAAPSSSCSFSSTPVFYQHDPGEYTSSASEGENSVYLPTIPEEPEPPELEINVQTVKLYSERGHREG